MEKLIYLDNAATTAVRPEVFEAMKPYFCEMYANPAGIYTFARKASEAVSSARETIAETIGADKHEIYFTSGGSESDNWAITAAAEAYAKKHSKNSRFSGHIITTAIEHHAVLHTCENLEKQGVDVSYIGVDENGFVKLDELEAAIRDDTFLITVMFANNEIGTIEPIKKIGEIAKKHGILFHTDAVQAYGHIPIDVEAFNIDMLSASGHKLCGPKGIGFLYIRKSVKIGSFIRGGAQENNRRAGTTNTSGIIGLAKAAEFAVKNMEEAAVYESKLRDYVIERVLNEIPYCRLNGDRTERLPNNINFCFRFVEGESLLIMLDQNGICASSGSACTSGSLDPSHVLLAIGLPHEIAHGSLRLTLSDRTTKEELDYTVEKIKQIVERLRGMSPLYEDFKAGEVKNV